ncbi:MAG TPA: amidase family protein [Candidatus Limnocylindrales bacterium]|nr:amidase family protein [Candidatus Limnocylindrales bacterium]
MASRQLSSLELTDAYLGRIRRLDPLLHAVIETNPEAHEIARRRDDERLAGRLRGPLHGIPVLLKDNIGTNDAMATTAGALALVGSRVPRDATLVRRLRAAGAVILGKANLSEWANFRGVVPAPVEAAGLHLNGWSARGGFTRNPYGLAWDPCGSSSGSAVAAAANLCAITIGTETDGSIVCPSGSNAVVGLKPTVGLVAQTGIIPIAHSQDTAGPMVRTVTDAAITLGVLRSPFGAVVGRSLPRDYRRSLRRGALRGARIGVDRRLFAGEDGTDAGLNAVAERAFDVLRSLGATLVDPIEPPDTKGISDESLTVLLTEFKVDIESYLRGLRGTTMRSLADLIAFNDDHCEEELRYFGQELFHVADATTGLGDPAYRSARERCLDATRRNGLDRILAADRLDAMVGPAYGDSSSAAISGYPSISVPTGTTDDGRPGGVWLSTGFLGEPTLLAFAFDLEQELGGRPRPTFRGEVPRLPPDAGICAIPTVDRPRTRRSDLPADL